MERPLAEFRKVSVSERATAFLLLTVPAKGSGGVVSALQTGPAEILEAAAIFSEIDVIARVRAWEEPPEEPRLGDLILNIFRGRIPKRNHEGYELVQIKSGEVFLPDDHLVSEKPELLSIDVSHMYAYVLVDVDRGQRHPEQVFTKVLSTEGVVSAYCQEKSDRILAKVRAPDKTTFDARIMTHLQREPGVRSTRTYIVINTMHWVGHPP